MAITTAALTGAITAVAQAQFPGSQVTPQLASAVSRSVIAWISTPTNVNVVGVTAGTSGTGSVNGKMQFTGPGGGLVLPALNAAGVKGPSSTGIGTSVGAGVLSTLNASAQYSGASFGVGVGTDVSKVVRANAATLIPIMLGNFQAQSVGGPNGPQLARGLSNGIASIVLTGTGFGGVVGLGSPVGGTGTSTSVLF